VTALAIVASGVTLVRIRRPPRRIRFRVELDIGPHPTPDANEPPPPDESGDGGSID
jgi:hypothetical protein